MIYSISLDDILNSNILFLIDFILYGLEDSSHVKKKSR